MVDIDGASRDAVGLSPGDGNPSATSTSLSSNGRIYVILDRLVAGNAAEDRLRDSLETAFSKGEGRCFVFVEDGEGGRLAGLARPRKRPFRSTADRGDDLASARG